MLGHHECHITNEIIGTFVYYYFWCEMVSVVHSARHSMLYGTYPEENAPNLFRLCTYFGTIFFTRDKTDRNWFSIKLERYNQQPQNGYTM